jgi:hypothetical protein
VRGSMAKLERELGSGHAVQLAAHSGSGTAVADVEGVPAGWMAMGAGPSARTSPIWVSRPLSPSTAWRAIRSSF